MHHPIDPGKGVDSRNACYFEFQRDDLLFFRGISKRLFDVTRDWRTGSYG